jgi:glycosyltransferase involved in cell wall biosynthesis
LAVTSELPWPLNSGGHLRSFHLLRALARRFRIRLVAAALPDERPSIEALSQIGIIVCPVDVGPRVAWREGLRAAAAAARGEPYVLYRRHHRRAVRAELARQFAVAPPDVFYLDHLDSLVYSDLGRHTRLVLDLHNVYSSLAQRVSSEQTTWWRRFYLHRESILLGRQEQRAARAVDRLVTVSDEDRLYFQRLGAREVAVVPNGVACEQFCALPIGRTGQPPLILFLGGMSWGPNISAARFLAQDALPRLQKRFPRARLRIVGRSPASEVKALARIPGVEVIGDVPDITPYLRQAKVLAVPLDSGGGTRLKILEAFAGGLPVVSTRVGCEGLGVRHADHLLIADRDRFAEGLASLLDDEELAKEIAHRARDLARHAYDWSIVGEAACSVVADLANSRPYA